MRLDGRYVGVVLATLGAASCTAIIGLGGDYTEGSGGSSSANPVTTASSGGASSSSTMSGPGGGGSGSVGGAGGGPSDVTGHDKITWVKVTTEVQQDEDLTSPNHHVSAWVPMAGGGYTQIQGMGFAGGFTIPNVPQGDYLLDYDGTDFYWLTNRNVDFGMYELGRPDLTNVQNAATTVTFNLTSLAPWASSDGVQLWSINGGTYAGGLGDPTVVMNPPAAGATTLQATFNYYNVAAPPSLLMGDLTRVMQLTQSMTGKGATYLTPVRTNQQQVTITDGADTVMGGVMDVVPQTGSITLDWKLTQFEALVPAVNPNAKVYTTAFSLDVLPSSPDHGPFTTMPDVIIHRPAPGADISDTFAYGDPFLANYARIVITAIDVGVPYILPNTTVGAVMDGYLRYAAAAPDVMGKSIVPAFGPPAMLQIDGKDGFMPQTLASDTPKVSWKAPAGAAPSYYQVRIYQLYPKGNATKRTNIAHLKTPKTDLQIPPSLMPPGFTYVILVDAILLQGVDFDQKPRGTSFPFARSTAISAMLAH